MTTLIRETETSRDYLFERTEIDGVEYYHVRRYELTDRWRRTKDQWYRVEEPELKTFRIDFDIRKDYPE